jgi:transcriptional regulator with XRE-family HTH domain
MENKKQHFPINVDFFEDLTGDISKSKEKQVEEIGRQVKTLREEKGLSLDALSKLTGFGVELLAGIENNEIQPQLGTVIKLSKALDSAFSRLVSGAGDKLYAITRKGEHKVVHRSTSHTGNQEVYTYESLAPEVKGRHMEAFIVHLVENPDPEKSVHDGEEFIYVLDGVASLTIGNDAFDLEPGDSVYYLSTTPHLIASKSGKTTILAVMYEG